jgi:hypothetical protein
MYKTREAANAWQRQWNKKNPEKVKVAQKKYYDSHREQRLANTRQWEKKNPERVKEKAKQRWAENPDYFRNWKKNNPDKVRAQYRMQRYGITIEEFQKMVVEQRNRCAICRKPETIVDKRTGEVRALAVDHDHKKNKVRRLLCRRCNSGIGMFEENIKLLSKAIKYLEEWK